MVGAAVAAGTGNCVVGGAAVGAAVGVGVAVVAAATIVTGGAALKPIIAGAAIGGGFGTLEGFQDDGTFCFRAAGEGALWGAARGAVIGLLL